MRRLVLVYGLCINAIKIGNRGVEILDTFIRMNLVLFVGVCLLAFVNLISMAAIYCIDFLRQYMNTHIAILVVLVATAELIIFGRSFAEYLIGG